MSETREEKHARLSRENGENLKRLAMGILARELPNELRKSARIEDLHNNSLYGMLDDAADVIEYLRDNLEKDQ